MKYSYVYTDEFEEDALRAVLKGLAGKDKETKLPKNVFFA